MLDENLPTFFLKASPDGAKHHRAVVLSHHGSEPHPAYALRYLDPSDAASKNCYASAIFDAHNQDILYGEVFARPGWAQPSLSLDEIRRNGGVPPPPQLLLPSEFAVQLYNPDQQVVVTQKPGSWGGSSYFEFSLPQNTFRIPSASALDRSQSDPVAKATTPRLNFVWRRESKLNKDMTCFMTGKSTDAVTKKKRNKEPDIAVALFRSLREITIYESNLYRVELEDTKGLEIVLLLGAIVIGDIYFSQPKDIFNITVPYRKDSRGANAGSPNALEAVSAPANTSLVFPSYPPQGQQYISMQSQAQGVGQNGLRPPINPQSGNDMRRQSLPRLHVSPASQAQDARSKWEIEAETARLKAAAEAEAKEQRRKEEYRRREQQKMDEAEARRIRKLVEAEEKERRRRQAETDKETERLRKKYGTQENLIPRPPPRPAQPVPHWPQQTFLPHPQPQQRRHSTSLLQSLSQSQVPLNIPHRPHPQAQQPMYHPSPYLHPGGSATSASASAFFHGHPPPNGNQGQRPKLAKRSIWGLRSKSEESGQALHRKKSSMF